MEWKERICYLVIGFGFTVALGLPVLPIFVDLNATEPWQSLQCNNSCEISIRNSSAISTFEKFSLDSSSALFVHFIVYNLSLKPSNDILDPLNLVWVESIDAPFLSLDLGFNVYSFGMLSRKVHHMTVVIEEGARRCLWKMNYTCATKALSTAFLQHVSKGRGVLCYTVKDRAKKLIHNAVIYQCCKDNRQSRQIECDIRAQFNIYMSAISMLVIVALEFTISVYTSAFCQWVNIRYKDSAETLSNNTQIRINPAYQLLKAGLGCLSRKWAMFVRRILVGFSFPILYYIDVYERWNIKEYQIPEMFNNSVKESRRHIDFFLLPIPFVYVAVYYNIGVLFYSIQLFLYDQSNAAKKRKTINWKIPFKKTTNFVRNTWCEERRLAKWILWFLKSSISPIICCFYLIEYACYISPLIHIIMTQLFPFYEDLEQCEHSFCFVILIIYGIFVVLFMLAIGIIIWSSLLLISKHIGYVLMGLVSNKDYLPLFTLFFVIGYYVWDCFNYESRKYQKLLEQTFEKCKQQQEGQDEPTISTLLQFDKNGAPRISTKLFQKVIDKILPRKVVYRKIFEKITIILLFLLLIYFSIMVYGKSSFNDYTRALAVLLGGIIPKLVESFRANSSKLLGIENSYKVEKIVNDFINLNENSGNGMPRDHLPERSQNGDCAIEITIRHNDVRGTTTLPPRRCRSASF